MEEKQKLYIRTCDDRSSMNMTVISTKEYPVHTDFDNEEDTVCIVFHQLEPRVNADSEDCGDGVAEKIITSYNNHDRLVSILEKAVEQGDKMQGRLTPESQADYLEYKQFLAEIKEVKA